MLKQAFYGYTVHTLEAIKLLSIGHSFSSLLANKLRICMNKCMELIHTGTATSDMWHIM